MQNNMLDSMHRGYAAYLEAVKQSADCDKLRRAVLRTEQTGERSDTALCTCEVKTDWLERIEEALPFVERAVHENRQFILRQGEIVPIEKVRRVSKTSVEHLARHSELITREPEEGAELLPEKLLMTENVGTYAVYENRFLYMLLCYVRDFAEIKYAKIAELSALFTSEVVFEKSLSGKTKQIGFSLRYKETSVGNASGEFDKETADCLVRIKNVIASVDTLLKTGLMVEVSQAPMLKPPIARTNVLLQNPCFVAAIELYDYLRAYTGDGYVQKDVYRQTGALSDMARADYAELVAIVSYLSYRNGGLYDELEARYRQEEQVKKDREKQARDQQLALLKEKLGTPDPIAAEYILALEEKCREAERENAALLAEKDLIRDAEEKMTEAEKLCAAMREELAEMKSELLRSTERERQNAEKHRLELENSAYLVRQKEEELEKAAANYQAESEKQSERFRAEYAALAEKYHLQSARLRAKEAADGNTEAEEDFSSKEAFAQLEAEYRAFQAFFEAHWKTAKKQIRRDRLWTKSKGEDV